MFGSLSEKRSGKIDKEECLYLYLKWTWKTDLALNLGNFLFHKCFVDKRLGHFSPNNTRSVT